MVDLALRAKKADLVSLPKAVKGASCSNCHYFRNTDNPEVGYCSFSEVSIFVTKTQLCQHWDHDGTVQLLTKTKTNLEQDFRDMPPPTAEEEFNFDHNNGLAYTDEEDKKRAVAARMISLPESVQKTGASCYTCKYSTSVGWCKNPHVNQAIHKDDKCKYWDHPGAVKAKKD